MPPVAGAADRDRTIQEWVNEIHALMAFDLGSAARAAKSATLMYPDAPNLVALKAEILLSRGYIEDANKALKGAVSLAPLDIKANIRLVKVAIRLGRIEIARRLIKIGLAGDIGAERLARLMECLIDLGDFSLATVVLRKALKRGDDQALRQLLALAEAGLARDQSDGATPQAKWAWLCAIERLRNGKPANAETLLNTAVEAWPRYWPAWVALRGALEARGRTGDAKALEARWTKAGPQSAAAVEAGCRRRLGSRGLLFDPDEVFPVVRKDDVLGRVQSVEDLLTTDNAYLMLNPGGQTTRHAPAVAFDDRNPKPIRVTSTAPETFLASLRNPMLVGRGVVVTEDGAIIDDITPRNPEKYQARQQGEGRQFDPSSFNGGMCNIRYFDTPAFLMMGPTDQSFGDWIINFPPKLLLAEAAGLDCPIVIGDGCLPQTVDTLAALGVSGDRLIRHDAAGVSVFAKLYAPSWPMMERLQHIIDPFAVYRRAVLPAPAGPGPRLYLSREGIGNRRLANEPQVRALFERRGFTVVHPERLNFRQIQETFANPSCVAGPYGSALLNLVFSNRQASCLFLAAPEPELFIREAVTWLGALDLRFGYVRGQSLEGAGDEAWEVSIELVEQALNQILDFAEA